MNLWAALFGQRHRRHDPPDFPEQTSSLLDAHAEDEDDLRRQQVLTEAQQRADDAARRLRALEFEQSLYRRKRPRVPL